MKNNITKDCSALQNKRGFICDMDGVVYHGSELIPEVKDFVAWLQRENKQYLFMTNGSQSPRALSAKLQRLGLTIGEEHFYSTALATACFLKKQCPGGSAYVIGESGLLEAVTDVGFRLTDENPDYVVFGEKYTMSYEEEAKAIALVMKGAKLIATNPDVCDPAEGGTLVPACRSMIAPIEMTTGKTAYYIGKPNPLMANQALAKLGCNASEVAIIGDRMDTDILTGLQSSMDTVLVLSGISTLDSIDDFAFRPDYILRTVGDIVPKI